MPAMPGHLGVQSDRRADFPPAAALRSEVQSHVRVRGGVEGARGATLGRLAATGGGAQGRGGP